MDPFGDAVVEPLHWNDFKWWGLFGWTLDAANNRPKETYCYVVLKESLFFFIKVSNKQATPKSVKA